MEDSVFSAIKKIKLQEQDNEAKLKEEREYESVVSSLKKSIRDATSETEKLIQEEKEFILSTDKLRSEVEMARIRHCSRSAQLISLRHQYSVANTECDQGIANVWTQRSSLCQTVNSVADECDIWALLARPITTETLPTIPKVDTLEVELKNESRLQIAKERMEKAKAEREKLRNEPDNGEEFVRIKNAINYSLNYIANLKL